MENYKEYLGYGLTGLDFIKLNSEKLAEIYNCSDIDALYYMHGFCEDEDREICERLITLNMETDLGWGREPSTTEEFCEYHNGKWKLLNKFGVLRNADGEAYVP